MLAGVEVVALNAPAARLSHAPATGVGLAAAENNQQR